jgi:hypothetical protein
MRRKIKHDERFFEGWARRNGMRPVMRISDVRVNGKIMGDVLIADSGTLLYQSEFPNQEHNLLCYYRTGYAIDRPGDKTWLAAFADYPTDAFYGYSDRQKARIDDCVKNAVQMMHQVTAAGLFDANRNRIRLTH